MKTISNAVAAAATVGLALVLGAQAATAQVEITYATDWKAQSEHGGLYQAVATGLYDKYGLDITLRPGGPGIDNQQLLAAGAIEMGTGSNGFFPLNLVNAGASAPAVLSMFQKDPQILMAHPGQGLDSLADMVGRPVMIANSSINSWWVWLAAKYGFTDDMIRPYTFNMAPWLIDETAIQQGYLSSEPFMVAKEGVEAEVFLLADEGYPSYSSMALVQGSLIESDPDLVQGFVDATIEGWYSYLYGDPGPGNALIMADNPEMDAETIAYGIEKMLEFGIVDSGDTLELGIGAMTDARWTEFFDVLVEAGVYDAGLDYQAAYTLQFINTGHGKDMK